MLLVHQAGSVRVGEVVRYTLTYTPSSDRILPSPTHLHVKIKNTSPIPLRAAYLHGPYSLYVSAFPSTFNPNQKVEEPEKYGVPEFEPFLKAGSYWTCKLVVPEELRETGVNYAGSPSRSSMDSTASAGKGKKSATWIIEVVSQVIFSTGAVVHYEVMVSRDERSLELGFAAVAAHGHGAPGQLEDHRKPAKKKESKGVKGVYSRAVKLVVEDTEALWNKPKLPDPHDIQSEPEDDKDEHKKRRNKQKVHLVVLTHGLHSNLNADMLYLKESIDATVAQARKDARERRAKRRSAATDRSQQSEPADKKEEKTNKDEPAATAPLTGGQEDIDSDEDDEMVIVRGFPGNAVKTERGIQYLGKRLAKFVMKQTYPSQPYLPIKKKTAVRALSSKFGSQDKSANEALPPSHQGSSIHRDDLHYSNNRAYQYTSISFVGHSLGGLVQLYAIAYIQKHAPDFFNIIKPTNFICMASPLLGLSNENPLYVKFALDFGLVGRTGQDLGLTWRAPTLAKQGWSAMGGVFGANKDNKTEDPGAKPLLRVLPTGPAHQVLHLFRNRTVYSNVVNDGIVPLRTSCLLFLDWKGLDKVDKYRRGNGLIGTVAEWGWAELTGANAERDISVSPNPSTSGQRSPSTSPVRRDDGETVPQPSETATEEDNQASGLLAPGAARFLSPRNSHHGDIASPDFSDGRPSTSGSTSSMLDDILNFFRPNSSPKVTSPSSPQLPSPRIPSSSKMDSPKITSPKVGHEKKRPKALKAIQRAQTLSLEPNEAVQSPEQEKEEPDLSRGTTDNPTMRPAKQRPFASRGYTQENTGSELTAPPKTSVFESAADLLHPPTPSTQWIIDPASRPRTIFHDRVYHPSDIPPAPVRRPSRLVRSFSSDKTITQQRSNSPTLRSTASNSSLRSDQGGMKVEEKIARAYHRDLSWRKVLVKLEPDAHNNMVVRRMFANAYGWPVVKHLCDTHFSDSFAARTRDEQETNADRANVPSTSTEVQDERGRKKEGEEVAGQTARSPPPKRSREELRETRDELGSLNRSTADINAIEARHRHEDSNSSWGETEHFFSASDSESEDEGVFRADEHQRPAAPAMSYVAAKEREGRRSPVRHVLHSSTGGKGRKEDGVETPDIILDPAGEGLVAEPESMDGENEVGASPTEVGLRKDVNAAMMEGVDGGTGLGISERVAGATGRGKEREVS
ncbi:DUF676-domain-containing protein [Myriangium duriaei CBS 260.36]|uniref:DUF676-domain-containing protein n=1 Tax=Myriangium duriaei CBS 260.36 TaxID=1168546 RepID=A0A9P4ISG2_9PEZI|nr:DUF676-domain-containing protein [Myriangium duriaei CBS 260.36]